MRLADRFQRPPPFWKRQFDANPTGPQTLVDTLFGILLPMACLVFDPFVFRGNDILGFTSFSRHAAAAYAFMGLQIAALGIWLLVRSRAAGSAAYFAGPFLAGSLFAFALGLALFPMSLIGLVAIVGIFGFTPFGTAFVFLRNGVRAWRQAGPQVGRAARTLLLATGALCGIAPAAAAHVGRERAMAAVIANPLSPEPIFWASVLAAGRADEVFRAYETEPDPVRRELLGMAYREITGEDPETRLARLRD